LLQPSKPFYQDYFLLVVALDRKVGQSHKWSPLGWELIIHTSIVYDVLLWTRF